MKIARIGVMALLVTATAVTSFAQRGGNFRQYSRSYAGNVPYDGKFVFIRMAYNTSFRRGDAPWAHDYPVGEEHFLKILTSISNVNAHVDQTSVMSWDDPELFKFPVAYMVEPGFWYPTESEIEGLKHYLEKGGFLIVDDFPSRAWGNFEVQMARAFPQAQWIELTPDHQIFHTFFEINSFDTMPPAYDLGGRPIFLAIFEDNDPNKRMLAIANYQNDLSEYWEYSETGIYMIENTNEAYKYGVNEFIYGLTR
jgi:hypothetical protein